MADLNAKFLNYEGLKELFKLIESTYAKSSSLSGIQDKFDSYVTTDAMNEELAKKANTSDVYNKGQVDQMFEELDITENLSKYATVEYVNEQVVNKATKEEIKNFLDKAEYDGATKSLKFSHGDEVKYTIECSKFFASALLESAELQDGKLVLTFKTESGTDEIEVDLSDLFHVDDYYTAEEVDTKLAEKLSKNEFNVEKENFETVAHAAETYATKDEIPSLTDYAKKTWVENQGYLTQHQSLTEYAKKTDVTDKVNSALEPYATKSYVTDRIAEILFPEDGDYQFDLDGYATEEWVKQELEKIDVTDQLSEYAKTSEVAETYVAKADVLTTNDIQQAFNEALGL